MPSLRPLHVSGVPLDALAGLAGVEIHAGGSQDVRDVVVTGATLDSRTVRPGDLYAALPGFTTHGAAFAREAVDAGAVAVLTDRDGAARLRELQLAVPVLAVDAPRALLGALAAQIYGCPADALTLVGVTGTNGKTTTAYLLESGLRHLPQGAPKTGLIGTVETRIGTAPHERLASARTTPEATDLHAILAMMREVGTTAAVMEVSSHALAQHRVDGAVFDVALFTNLSQDHLDFHADMDDYFGAKALLFTPAHARRGLICLDDEWGVRLHHQATIPTETITSRTDTVANWYVRQADWPTFTVEGRSATLHLTCHLPGDFNIVNTGMAAVALLMLGHAPAAVEQAMAHEPQVPGRMQRVTGRHEKADDPRVLVDYAHTPDAVDAALAAIRPSTSGELVVVLGAGGDRDRGKRPAMGAAAARWADIVIVTDDNPRSEDPASIRAAVEAGALESGPRTEVLGGDLRERRVENVPGRAAAIEAAVRWARHSGRVGDSTVLILGKGHETGQDIAGVTHAFDDRDAARAALDGLPYRPETTA